MVSRYLYVTICKVNYSHDKIMQAKCYCHSMQTFLPFHIGRKQIWPANNCLQIMVCSCLMFPNCVWLQKIFCPWINETMRDRSCLKKADCFTSQRYSSKNKLGDRMIKQLLNSVRAKYRDLPVPRTSIICLSLRLQQIIDQLAQTNHNILLNLIH